MKFGYRKPNLTKSFKARTTGRLNHSIKRAVNPMYGKKGVGMITKPKKSVYNKVYHQTTRSVINTNSKSKANSSTQLHPINNDQEYRKQRAQREGGIFHGRTRAIFFLICGVIILFIMLTGDTNPILGTALVALAGYETVTRWNG